MKLWISIWHFWKWLCVALMTSFAVLALLAAFVTMFKSGSKIDKQTIEDCMDTGGTWDADAGKCKHAA